MNSDLPHWLEHERNLKMKTYLQRAVYFLPIWLTIFGGRIQAGDFSLNSLFSDHMVLQRNQPIRVFGTGANNSEVVVTLAGREARSTVRDGIWEVQLPAMTAGGPDTIEVAGPHKLTLTDVMIGDVWVGSGQSNMGMALKGMPEYVKNPSVFYNGMIAPLQRFPIKGIVWYQGGIRRPRSGALSSAVCRNSSSSRRMLLENP